MFEPSGNYPNLLGITPADGMPKLQGLRAKTCILDEAPTEYNIDFGNPFGDKTVYIKTPMRLEDFDMTLTFSEDFIRSNTRIDIMKDPLTKDFEVTVSFNGPFGPEFKAIGRVSHFIATVEKDAFQNMKNKLTDVLVCKVKTYYEGKVIKEEKNMHTSKNYCDEICEYLGLTTKTPNNKPKWIEGLPAVKKVDVYNSRVVKVTFVDGTFTKSVCSENDTFNMDVGITICAMKRLLGTNSENATHEYNRFMNHVHKVMTKNEEEQAEKNIKEMAEKAKKRKIELKKAAKKLKAKEEQIDIYKQAILRAQKETFSQFEDGGSI